MLMLMQNINPNENSATSQRAKIKAWLQAGNTITGMEALYMVDSWRLPARIDEIRKELKAEGGKEKIITTMVKTPGKRKLIARYSLVVGEPETATP